jgi:serine/threonine protein kinase
VLNGEWSGHSFVARRFKAEARIASAIGHPNIVEVFDAGELPDKRLFLVMEHLDGHDLAQELAECGTLSPLRTARSSARSPSPSPPPTPPASSTATSSPATS